MTLHRLGLISVFLLAASTVLFWNLGKVPLFDPDEGRYSEMALHMVQSGDWMTPRMNGIVHVHKPPLSNWFVALSIKLLGANEFAVRLPSVLLSLLLLLALMHLGNLLFDFETGYRAAWILLTSSLYLAVSRLVTTDMALTTFTFLAMTSIAHVFFGKSHRIFFFYMAAILLGLSMLTKGPVSWMIVLTPTVLFGIWKKRKLPIPRIHLILGTVLMLGISASWFVAFILSNEGAWDYFIHYQLLGRIFRGTAGRAHPFYYYLLLVPLTFIPWSIMMPAAANWLNRKIDRSGEEREKIDFIFCWFIIPFILFSVFRTKLATYIVPVFPPLALMAGLFWTRFLRSNQEMTSSIKKSLWPFSLIYLPLLIGGVIFIQIRPKYVQGIPLWDLAFLGIILVGGTFTLYYYLRQKKYTQLFNAQVVIFIFISLTALDALPTIQFKNSKVFAQKILEFKKPADKVIMFNNYYASLPFYLQERVIEVYTNAETNFEKEEILKDYIYQKPEPIQGFVEGPQRVFIVTNQDGPERIRIHTLQEVYTLLKVGKNWLFSNRES